MILGSGLYFEHLMIQIRVSSLPYSFYLYINDFDENLDLLKNKIYKY